MSKPKSAKVEYSVWPAILGLFTGEWCAGPVQVVPDEDLDKKSKNIDDATEWDEAKLLRWQELSKKYEDKCFDLELLCGGHIPDDWHELIKMGMPPQAREKEEPVPSPLEVFWTHWQTGLRIAQNTLDAKLRACCVARRTRRHPATIPKELEFDESPLNRRYQELFGDVPKIEVGSWAGDHLVGEDDSEDIHV